jgi:hypothetical protein
LHRIWHVLAIGSQPLLQTDGQLASTQNPWSQTRPSPQSSVMAQEKSDDRRSTKHPCSSASTKTTTTRATITTSR